MRLYLFSLATMQPGNVPVPSYLIQTDEGANVLVDTGWPQSFVEKPQNPPGLTIVMRPEDMVVARLASVDLSPSDIDYVVCSHFDDDHSGNHDLFTKAEFVVQREHYELAKGGHPRFAANRSKWDNSLLHYRVVEGDVELLPGIVLLETSGHVPGHQSLLVRLPNTGPVVIAIDAVMHSSMADAQTRPIFITDMDDEERIRNSTQKISDIAKHENAAFIIFGHDSEQWPRLKHSPDFYD
jgi:N-acyl homoserine lactone hydrolase